jgi:hypothetical protein
MSDERDEASSAEPAEPKASEPEPTEPEPEPAEPEPAEPKASEPEPSEPEPAEPKASEPEPTEPEPAEAKPAQAVAVARPAELPVWVRGAVPLVALGVAITAGKLYGPPGVVLVLAGVALVSVIGLFWQSLRTLLGETPLSGADAYALGAPRTEEEQKRNVLRALKDLEFERAVGKISDDDYKQLVTHYRKEAKRLLRVIDEQNAPQRARAARIADERLAKLGLAPKADDAAKTDDARDEEVDRG